ncbi:hypothetical protein Lal_00019076 [Lupinus albus]|nr:hypothetical protein Lal_00019076 [Lupinus albus]
MREVGVFTPLVEEKEEVGEIKRVWDPHNVFLSKDEEKDEWKGFFVYNELYRIGRLRILLKLFLDRVMDVDNVKEIVNDNPMELINEADLDIDEIFDIQMV